MATPSMEERIMELMPDEAKAVLLLPGRRHPYEARLSGRADLTFLSVRLPIPAGECVLLSAAKAKG